jgi:hypothetical protein
MNTSFIRIVAVICVAMLSILNVNNSLAGNYTWTGSANKDWNNSANWSPSGTPSTNDTVTIGAGSDTLLIAANTTINRLVISGRVVNLGGYQLEITQRASLNGGKIYNGTLKMIGTYAFFQGTNTNCTIDCISNQIKLSGGTFDGTGTFEQNGTVNGWGDGGCVFNGAVTMKKSGTASFRLGGVNPDTFNAKATFICTNSGNLEISHASQSVFRDSVFLNTTHSTAHISFCNSSTLATLEQEAVIVTGSTGLTNGKITLKALQQTSNKSNILSGAGNLLVNVDSCQFTGEVNITAPSILIKNNIFNAATTLIKTTASTNSYSSGGNIFNASATIENQDATRAFRLANESGDTYNADVKFDTGTNNVQVGYKGNNYFAGNITINSTKVVFNASSGKMILKGANDQIFYGEAAYNIGKLEINKDAGTVTLTRSMTIDSSITFIKGIINTDSTITLKAAVNCSGASNLSFVDGPVKKIGNTAFVFPVGDEGQWNPIEITAPTNVADAFTAQFYLQSPGNLQSKDSTIWQMNTCSYWNLLKSAGNSSVHVYLYWDSIACGLYDTTGLGVANWNGSTWKDLGVGGITGNILAGKIRSELLPSGYGKFTWAYRRISPSFISIPVNPSLQLNANNTWNHSISEDYFGYNGANILDAGQHWSDLSDFNGSPILRNIGISSLRLNGGTFGCFWDWRTGWFIPENELPNNWFYTRFSHQQPIPSFTTSDNLPVNDMSYFKISNDAIAGHPIFHLNSLTSGFHYELASFYRAGELNIPVKYVELGNEFYLNDEQFIEKYPSAFEYINYATDFTKQLKDIAPFNSTKVAVVGASVLNGNPGRRINWLNVVLDNINRIPTQRPDAITIHEYNKSGLKDPVEATFSNSTIGKMFIKSFSRADDLFDYEIDLINQKSFDEGLVPPLEVWITEYNLNDDEGNTIGTWAHGLFNAIQTLKYLESPTITQITSHTMTSNAVFGNIFESTTGFMGLTSGQLPWNVALAGNQNFPTTKFGFTASGAAMNEIGLAMKGRNVEAHRIDFSADANTIGDITYTGLNVSSNYLNLYGWTFEKEEGTEIIILNLGFKEFYVQNPCSLGYSLNNYVCPDRMVQMTCLDPTAGIGSIVTTLPTNSSQLFTTGEINISGPGVNLPPFSLTRLIWRNPSTLTIRLTDHEICGNTQTSVLVQGLSFNQTCSLLVNGQLLTTSTDSLFLIGNLNPGTYSIQAFEGSIGSNVETLTVNAPISVTITGNGTPCQGTDITLSANVSTSFNSDLNPYYSHLWIPTDQIISGDPFQSSITIPGAQLQTAAYQVFVYDGYCFASSPIKPFDRGPVSVDAGEDFTTCSAIPFRIRVQTTSSPLLDAATYYYRLKDANGTILQAAQTNNQFNPISQSTPGSYTYRVEVWSDDGQISNENCPQWDEVTVEVVACCNCSSGVSLNPSPQNNTDGPHINYSKTEDLYDVVENINGFTRSVNNGTMTISYTSPQLPQQPIPICINGELWFRPATISSVDVEIVILEGCTLQLGENGRIRVRSGLTLILRGCLIKSCDGIHMWDGIYVDEDDQFFGDASLEITNLNTTNTNIQESKNALVLKRESPFSITSCDFTNNYKDIVIEKYLKTGLDQQATTISNCTMSSNATLLAPHASDTKLSGIWLEDIENRTIGQSGTSADQLEISNALYGIYAHNASFTLLNTKMHDIWEDPSVTNSGNCVYSSSDFDYCNRNTTIGNGLASGINYFYRATNGIFGNGEMNYTISYNTFGQNPTTGIPDAISRFSIGIFGSGAKDVIIEKQNKFYDYTNAIELSDLTGRVYINDNRFWNGVFPSGATGFEGIAINVSNPINTTLPNSEISENRIGTPNGNNQPRIGIRLSNVNKLRVMDNEIYFNPSSAPAEPHKGILAEGCEELKIFNHANIENTTGFSSGIPERLIGIDLNQSPHSCIENNTLTNFGYGMQVTGNSVINSFYMNTFDEFIEGVHFNNGDIGAKVGTQSTINPNDGNVMGNIWTCSSCSSNQRITGIISGAPLFWFTPTNSFTDPEFPDNSVTGGLVSPFYLSGNTTSNTECTIPSVPIEDDPEIPIDLTARNLNYGGVVADSNRYPEAIHDEIRYTNRLIVYKLLKKYPALLNFDDPSDTSFVNFYNSNLTGNLNKIDSIEKLLNARSLAAADSVLQYFDYSNTIEYNYKKVYSLYLKINVWGDTSLTESDWDELHAIAYENPLTGGKAVFVARNILRLEVDDKLEENYRQLNRKHKSNNQLKIHPNPASAVVYIQLTETEKIDLVQVIDITGRMVVEQHNANEISVNILSSGIYLIQAKHKGEMYNEKLVINK